MEPVVYLKIAYGSLNQEVRVNLNWNLGRFARCLESELRNCFTINPNERIEIVMNRGTSFSELGNKLPVSPLSLHDYLERESFSGTRCAFYGRIMVTVGNTEYIKSDINIVTGAQQVSYYKKEELEEMSRGQRNRQDITVSTNQEMNRMTPPLPPPVITQEICSICSENPIHSECRYNCIHLFCTGCTRQWGQTCPLCREPSI